MLPEMLEDPYVEVSLQAPPSPDYVPGPEHADDEIVAEDQPYAEDASPIALSPEYVPESNFEARPEDDDDEDPEEDPVDYPADGGDDGDDEEESSEDDEEMDVEADEEEEGEHPAPADSVVVAPTATDQAPSAEETEPFKTDESAATPPPHPAYCTTARISIPAPVPMPAWTDSEATQRHPPNGSLTITGRNLFNDGKSSSGNEKPAITLVPKTLHEHSRPKQVAENASSYIVLKPQKVGSNQGQPRSKLRSIAKAKRHSSISKYSIRTGESGLFLGHCKGQKAFFDKKIFHKDRRKWSFPGLGD
nr:hypothetical protein [Tanacetum cinerariifolium]